MAALLRFRITSSFPVPMDTVHRLIVGFSTGVAPYGTEGHVPPIFGPGPNYFRSEVKSSCLYSTRRNVELWFLCTVLFVYMVRFNHKTVMVKINKVYFSTNTADFMAFYFTETHILL